MESRTDKNSYTILFAIAMVLVVGALLAFASSGFSDKISENKRLEKQQNILYAMGVNENDESSVKFIGKENVKVKDKDGKEVSMPKVTKEFNQYITHQMVIQDGKATEDDQAYLIDIKKEKAEHKNDPSKRRLPLFVGEKDGKKVFVAPVYGKGLWDAIWGYVALDENMIVQGVYFDHKGETPGLGANIKERFFMDDFTGEHLMSESGAFKGITVTKGNADPKNIDKTDNEVDAMAGATITGNGVTAMLKSDLRLYHPYIESLKNKN